MPLTTYSPGDVLTASSLNANLVFAADNPASGMQFITSSAFSAVSSGSVNDCFSSTFNNYRIIVSDGATASTSGLTLIGLRLRVNNADETGTQYSFGRISYFTGGPVATSTDTGTFFELVGSTPVITAFSASADVIDPQRTARTQYNSNGNSNQSGFGAFGSAAAGQMKVTTSYTGFTLLINNGTLSCTVAVYGYKKA